ncbi:MAG TPA: tyrosine-type recombinase/integrase [Acidimicrobiales bacterium]|nr:tyrosine-type recombinase/integrase [Acidimicrobiales bacterium]
MEWVQVGEPEVHRQRGKWVVRQGGYDPATGRRRVKQLGTFATKRAALAHQKAVAERRAGGEGETLGEFLERVWLPSKQGRVELATLDQYSWAVRRHIVPLLGAVRLRDLTAEVVDGWLVELTAVGESGKPRLGPTSARLVRKVLSMALEEAVQRGRLARNPVVLTQPPRRDRAYKKLGWTLEETRRFLSAASGHRLHAAFHLCLVTGLRRGEVLALRWTDVDVTKRELQVVQQLTTERGRPVLKQLKTQQSERIVTFGPATAAVLEAHREKQRAEAKFAGGAWKDQGLVFTTALGGRVDPNNFGRLMDSLVERAGVPRITPKGLRHTAQSIGRVVVGDDKVMQERLGHADIGITLGTYTHVVTDQHRQAGERLDEVFSP